MGSGHAKKQDSTPRILFIVMASRLAGSQFAHAGHDWRRHEFYCDGRKISCQLIGRQAWNVIAATLPGRTPRKSALARRRCQQFIEKEA
jgi:hypothetical protein